jgi:SNF2 family DNA or RNA helicase
MLREEQIDLRKQRAREGRFQIENLGKNRVFSDFRITNPDTGGQYTVTVRGFEIGDNSCTCPDFRANTLGTCKHVEAVLDSIREEIPENVRKRKAIITRPEVFLDYREPLRLAIHLPQRHSAPLGQLAARFFDSEGFWNHHGNFSELITAIEKVPEEVTVLSDAMDYLDREIDRKAMLHRETELLQELEQNPETPLRHLLKGPLYEYQIRGAIFAACRGRSILGDDMGLGKTIQTMAAVEILARERAIRKVLVIAPASVKYQWEGEIRKFTDREVQVVEGLKTNRHELYSAETFYRLVNYEQVVRDLDEINGWHPDLVVLDEAQRIKNWESKTSKSVKKLRSRYAMVLTGTPLENKLEELYSIVNFVDDRRLGPAFQFLHEHRVLDEAGNLVAYRNLDKIREKLSPILLRRTRSEVLSELPARTDNNVFVELSEAQRTPYEEQRTALARLLQKSYLTDLDRKRVLACLVNMRLICDSTFLFDKETHQSPKIEEVREILHDLLESDDRKVVVFSQWETMLNEVAAALDESKIAYALLHGGLSGKDRRAVMEQFKNDPACRLFLSTDAGGTGLNLQHADTVINLELPWNPAVLEQRIARVHRMGQSRPVRVINFVTRGTIEERVLKALEAKRNLFAGVFDSDSDEVNFVALNQQSFLDGVRTLIDEERPSEAKPPLNSDPPSTATSAIGLLAASVQLLEAMAKESHSPAWSPELKRRALTAMQLLMERWGE